MAWKHEKGLIAERFGKDEMPGLLTKQAEARGDEFVVLERNGEIYLEKEHAKISVSNLMRDFTDILMVDKSEKTIENELKNVYFADGNRASMKLVVKFRVLNSDHFSKKLMGERKRLFLGDVWNEMVSCIIYKKILPRLQSKAADEMSKSGAAERARAGFEAEVRRKFKVWGLMLTSLSMSFSVSGGTENVEEAQEEGTGEGDDAKVPPEAKGMREETGGTLEDEADELEKERLEREVAMELDKKQMQKDTEDAMEAMELKDVQAKKKALRESASKDAESSSLEEELENLRKAKDLAEKKFYKKELSEEAFQRMMEEFERRIIEIETKLKPK
jgi:hypothetical protein